MSGVNSPDPRIQPIWVTSQNELAHYLVEVGRERGLDEAAARLRIPPIMRVLWSHAELWRLAFKSQSWLDRRRGDGHLLGAPDGGFGALGDHIDQANWTVSLGWVRRRYWHGRIDQPYEFAHCYLGLHLKYQDDLRKLPRSVSLELRFIAIEAALIDVLTTQQQSQSPAPQMNLHLHTTVPSESEKQAPEFIDQTTSLDAISPEQPAGARPCPIRRSSVSKETH